MILTTIVGCGDGTIATEPVEGTVTLDKKPLAGAKVKFSPVTADEGDAGFATTDENGHYKLQTLRGAGDAGTTPGEYIVTISKTDLVKTGKMVTDDDGKEFPQTRPEETLPSKYTNRKETKLRAVVVDGENTFDFDLESK